MNFTKMITKASQENAEEGEQGTGRKEDVRDTMILVQKRGNGWKLSEALRKVIGPKWEEEWIWRRGLYISMTRCRQPVIIGVGRGMCGQDAVLIMNEWGTFGIGKDGWAIEETGTEGIHTPIRLTWMEAESNPEGRKLMIAGKMAGEWMQMTEEEKGRGSVRNAVDIIMKRTDSRREWDRIRLTNRTSELQYGEGQVGCVVKIKEKESDKKAQIAVVTEKGIFKIKGNKMGSSEMVAIVRTGVVHTMKGIKLGEIKREKGKLWKMIRTGERE